MTRFYDLAARASGMAAVVCAALAVLAYPGPAQADVQSDCLESCKDVQGADQLKCYGICVQQGGLTKCSETVCDDGLGACTTACANKACNEGGKNPATAKCASVTAGCRCI